MNIPNTLSLMRIFLVPVFIGLYFAGELTAALAVLLISAVSDVLDGAIARRFHMETRLGRALDPVADKLFEGAMMLCAASVEKSVWILLALHVIREVSLAVLAFHTLKITGAEMHSRWYGKLCTVSRYVLMLAVLALPGFRGSAAGFGITLCSALIVLCAVLYLAEFVRLLKRQRSS